MNSSPGKNQTLYTLLSLFAIFISTVVFLHKEIFLHQALFFDLTTRYFYPMMSLFREAVLSKQNPLWNPFLYSGIPFLANPQAGVFYPFSYIFVLFSFPAALNAYIFLHVFLAGAFMYFLGRHFKLTHISSVGAAFLFMFNGFFVLHFEFVSNIASYIWMPLALLYFDKFYKENDFQCLLFTALVLTLQFLGGMPAFSYYTFTLLLCYFIFVTPSLTDPQASVIRDAGKFLLLAALFLAFSSVQIFPTAQLVYRSVRNSGLDYLSVTGYSIRLQDFAGFLLIPLWDTFKHFCEGDAHVVGFYFGLISLIIIILFILRKQSKTKVFFAEIFLIFSILSLGKNLPIIYRLFYGYLPGLKYFRFPAQLMYVSVFALAVVLGYSLENIRSTLLKGSLVVLMFCELFLFGMKANQTIDSSYFQTTTPAVTRLACDPNLYRIMMDPALRRQPPPFDRDSFKFWLNYKDMLYPNIGIAYNLFDADGFETLRLKEYDDVLSRINGPHSKILDFLNVKYLFTGRYITGNNYKLIKDGYAKMYLNENSMPRFFSVHSAKYLPRGRVLDYMAGEEFDPAAEVVLDEKLKTSFPEIADAKKQKKALIYIDGYKLNEIKLTVACPRPFWLVTSETYYPGWKAKLDGKKAEILKANYAFKALFVPRGSHSVIFSYYPASFAAGVSVSTLSLLAALLIEMILGIIYWRKKRSSVS